MVNLEKQILEANHAEDAARQREADLQDEELRKMKADYERQSDCDCEYYDDGDDFVPEYVYRWKALATTAIAAGVTCVEIFASGGAIWPGIFATMIVWWN